jgi:ABC-type phosphate transport system permease subunit
VLAAFVYLMTGFSVFIAFVSVSMMMGVMTMNTADRFVAAVPSSIGLAALAIGATLAWGVLKARGWGRWIGIGVSTLMCVALCAGIIAMGVSFYAMSGQFISEMEKSMNSQGGGATAPNARNFLLGILAMYAVPLLAGLLLHAAAIWALVTRRASEWFRLAREIRAEHRRVKAELAL